VLIVGIAQQNYNVQAEATPPTEVGVGTISIRLTPDDLMKMRFAYSPVLEMVTSYRHLAHLKNKALYWRWVEEVRRSLYEIDFPYLDALLTSGVYVPDFITPTPISNNVTLEGELQRIQEVPADLIRKNISTLIQFGVDLDILHHFLAYPHDALFCLLEEMRLYWKLALAHHWPRMLAVAEGDVMYRARQLALEGSAALFGGLYPKAIVQMESFELKITKPNFSSRAQYDLGGQGLYLVPTIFNTSVMWQIEPEWQPMLIYSPRGTGLWWEPPSPAPDQSLEIALGEGRARVLRLLLTPSNTGEIAQQLHMTAGAASQHLSRLNQAGLVEPHRSGRRVYYHLTQRGEQLLRLFM
jgi:hypothetical protein